MKKIGIYGGSFDPIHFGHLNLAIELKEKGELDEVWFVPAGLNPHKTDAFPLPFSHRLKLVELAIHDIPGFRVKDLEGMRVFPSYTIHTVKEFVKAAETPCQFYLLMGEDTFSTFFHWYQVEELINIVHLFIGSRTSDRENSQVFDSNISVKGVVKKTYFKTRLVDISGTAVRERLKNKLYCGHLVPYSVLNYIYKNYLY